VNLTLHTSRRDVHVPKYTHVSDEECIAYFKIGLEMAQNSAET
jgi:hypothetical protein